MGKAIVIGLAIIIIVAMWIGLIMYLRRKDGKEKAQEKGWALKGDLNARQERVLANQNDAAETLFLALLAPPKDISGDITLLSNKHRDNIENWLAQQSASSSARTRKGIELS